MGLGLLGAFGKTNAPDVVGGLFNQYNQGLIAAENIRKSRAAEELQLREERRAQAKFDMDKKEYDYQRQMVKVDDQLEKLPYKRTAQSLKEFYKISGVMDEKGYARRMDLSAVREDALKYAEKDPERNIMNLIQDFDDHIATLKEKLKTAKPEDAVAIQKDIDKNVAFRNNTYAQLPMIREHYAKKKAEVDAVDPGGETQKLQRDKLRAEAESERALANRRNAEAEAGATGGKLLTTGVVKDLQKNVQSIVGKRLLGDVVQRGGYDAQGNYIDPSKPEDVFRSIVEGDELVYEFYNEVNVRAQEIYKEHKGLLPPVEAALQAYEDVYNKTSLEERRRRQAERVGRGTDYRTERNKAMGSNLPTEGAAPSPDQGPDTEAMFNGGGWENGTVGVESGNGRVIISPENGMVYTLTPPEGMNEKDKADLFEAIETAVKKNTKTPLEIFNILSIKYKWKHKLYDRKRKETEANNPYPGEYR